MKAFSVWVSILLALVAAFITALWVTGREPPSVLSELRQIHIPEKVVRAAGQEPRVSQTIYLNREGAMLRAGPDDARFNRSSIVKNHDLATLDVPAFAGSTARWNRIVKCLRDRFSPYAVEIVDRRPVDREYLMAVVGGSSDALPVRDGHGHEHRGAVTGLAPYDGRPIADAVVLVFAETLRNDVRAICETAAMELAHAYGLDHTYDCRDLMTYKKRCGRRRFMDRDMKCGEYQARDCGDGRPTQNSHRRLLKLLGSAAAQ